MAIDLDEEFFQALETRILAKNWSWVAERVSLPLVAYAGSKVETLRDMDALDHWLRGSRPLAQSQDVDQVVSEISEFRPVSASMASYLVTHRYIDKGARVIGLDTLRYFACRNGDISIIEMIEKP